MIVNNKYKCVCIYVHCAYELDTMLARVQQIEKNKVNAGCLFARIEYNLACKILSWVNRTKEIQRKSVRKKDREGVDG